MNGKKLLSILLGCFTALALLTGCSDIDIPYETTISAETDKTTAIEITETQYSGTSTPATQSSVPPDTTASTTPTPETRETTASATDTSETETSASAVSTKKPSVETEIPATDPPVTETSIETSSTQTEASVSEPGFDIASIPAFSGDPYTVIHENVPYFSSADLIASSYEYYSALDSLGRCGIAMACVGRDIMPTEERGNIGQVKPSGWHTVKYDFVDGKYLYNRCHLIGYQLTAENANTRNLITGTRYLNVQGMLPFENMVADYIKETDNHVLYRVSPIFEGNNLLASGVLMEAKSVEDNGDGIEFCVYCYNVQPGVTIDYKTGESAAADTPVTEATTEVTAPPATTATKKTTVSSSDTEPTSRSTASEPAQTTYILNTNTKKFHKESCASAGKIKAENKDVYTGSRDDLINMGYDPCKNCNP